jgi:hypothetical protein
LADLFRFLAILTQGDAIAQATNSAVQIVATRVVRNAVAITHIEPVLGAVPPDRVLHEPGESRGQPRVELPGVNRLGNCLDDVGAPASLITG